MKVGFHREPLSGFGRERPGRIRLDGVVPRFGTSLVIYANCGVTNKRTWS
jgi:hypothetical protein